VTDDLIVLDAETTQLHPVTGYTPSPVESIDGVDVVSFLLTRSLVGLSQDPDALWNQNFFQVGNLNADNFMTPNYYPGPSSNITLANGTTLEFTNVAVVNVALDGVSSGDDAYTAFCPGAVGPASPIASAAVSSSAQASATQAPPSSPTVPLYPYPVIKHSANSVAGYYLNDTGLTDVAVLQVQSFESQTDNALDYSREFQMVVQKFLDAAVKTGKSKLIIDLQGNGGKSREPNSLTRHTDFLVQVALWISAPTCLLSYFRPLHRTRSPICEITWDFISWVTSLHRTSRLQQGIPTRTMHWSPKIHTLRSPTKRW
jgi:hypothetical protein